MVKISISRRTFKLRSAATMIGTITNPSPPHFPTEKDLHAVLGGNLS